MGYLNCTLLGGNKNNNSNSSNSLTLTLLPFSFLLSPRLAIGHLLLPVDRLATTSCAINLVKRASEEDSSPLAEDQLAGLLLQACWSSKQQGARGVCWRKVAATVGATSSNRAIATKRYLGINRLARFPLTFVQKLSPRRASSLDATTQRMVALTN